MDNVVGQRDSAQGIFSTHKGIAQHRQALELIVSAVYFQQDSCS